MISAPELLKKTAQRVAADEPVAVPSPCMSVCRMDANTELCEGCFRTLDEIAAWGALEDPAKRDVWMRIGQRACKMDA